MLARALLRLINSDGRLTGLRDTAAEYCEMASSCCRVLIARSPRSASFLPHRSLNSMEKVKSLSPVVRTSSLTDSPCRMLAIRLLSQLAHHLVETVDCVRNAVNCFETFTYGPINVGPERNELQTTNVKSMRYSVEEILTATVVTKASFQDRFVNVAFAHSLKSHAGVAGSVGRLLCWIPSKFSLFGRERHRCVKSDGKG